MLCFGSYPSGQKSKIFFSISYILQFFLAGTIILLKFYVKIHSKKPRIFSGSDSLSENSCHDCVDELSYPFGRSMEAKFERKFYREKSEDLKVCIKAPIKLLLAKGVNRRLMI